MNEQQEIDLNEAQEIERILRDYFTAELDDPNKVEGALSSLATIVQDQGAKLVHLGNVLFLVIVRGKGIVEIHTLGHEAQPKDLAQDFIQLAQYLKNIEVKTAYTYTEDNRFSRLAKMTGLPVKEFKADVEGKPMNVYLMEL